MDKMGGALCGSAGEFGWARARFSRAVAKAAIMMRLALVLVLVAAAVLFVAEPASAQGVLDCSGREPDGWTVIPQASSVKQGSQFSCNYRVRHAGGMLSGTAISIDYFCTPAEGAARWDSVAAASRKTETKRINGELLVTEEGPAAKNPDNPQSRARVLITAATFTHDLYC